ncbi:aldose 1-epimerase family protein [Weissella diestrammenae]|uniref:Aldose 1-epimerase family protein n=1 Tax=Weissella diestrammenae TaxID=1162633 RepID=A0A7G9T7Q3_9LACO|nr:aldose 1-epimerase family protein [Weissella diestrammenae]QNN76128.1 aldose 1-epimerase family protein [Weissella diestrammenae]
MSIENGHLKATINEHGAELISVINQQTKIEYMWQADAKIWGRHAPNLFPIVGRLKDNQYEYKQRTYHLNQHGFARDSEFTVVNRTPSQVRLRLQASEASLAVYPFEFQFDVIFELLATDIINIQYLVTNTDVKILPFSFGGHPGFNVPLQSGETFEDYQITIKPNKIYERQVLNGPFVDPKRLTSLDTHQSLPVKRSDYLNDAIIITLNEQPVQIEIMHPTHHHGISMNIDNAKYAGIWTKADVSAPFLCLEPWWGIADTIDATGNIENKMAINKINPGETQRGSYSIRFF